MRPRSVLSRSSGQPGGQISAQRGIARRLDRAVGSGGMSVVMGSKRVPRLAGTAGQRDAAGAYPQREQTPHRELRAERSPRQQPAAPGGATGGASKLTPRRMKLSTGPVRLGVLIIVYMSRRRP